MSADTAPQEQTKPPERESAASPSGAPESAKEEGAKKAKRPAWVVPLLAVVAVIALVWIYRSWSFGQSHASTDDAQVASRLVTIAPKIGGTVTEVGVDDNQIVKKGDLLAVIDPSSYAANLAQAQANLALARAQERQAEVNVGLTGQTGSAQIAQAEGGVAQNEGGVGSSRSEVDRAVAAVATSRAQASGAEANVKSAEAAYDIALANIAKANDGVREAQANAANARAAVKSAQAAVVSAQATEERARKDNERFQSLFSQGAVSAQTVDQTVSALRVATAQREAAQENVRAAQAAAQQREAAISTARSGVLAARSQAEQARTQIQANRVAAQGASDAIRQAQAAVGTAQANVSTAQGKVQQAQGVLQQAKTADTQLEVSRVALVQAKAKVAQAEAALRSVQIDFGNTKIFAPIGGKVSRRTATVGQQVSNGTPLMQIVPQNEIWVMANFKETQLRGVQIGQPVEVEVDALGGEPLKAHVASLSPNTGAAVALLPPDNATGNFTKVVQRVPVKILFEAGQPRVAKLAVGMSVIATIDTAAGR